MSARSMLSLVMIVAAAAGCATTQTLSRDQVVDLARQPERQRPYPADAPLHLHTDNGAIGPKPLRTLQMEGEVLRIDNQWVEPKAVQFGEVTVTSKARTAGLVAGVTVGAVGVAGTVAFAAFMVCLTNAFRTGG